MKVFAVAGVGLGMSIGAVAAGSALGPEGHELADLIAKHNRLNTRQMRIHVGGSANVASASAGLTFTF